jgi:hypothetical protein
MDLLVDLLDLSRDVVFLILWQATTALTVLQTAVLAHPTMSTSANDDGNPNLSSPTDDPAAPAAKRRKGQGPQANNRNPSVPRASSSRRTKCAHLRAHHMHNRLRTPAW